jgi:hypothetical protein
LRDLNPLKSRERLKSAKDTLDPLAKQVSGSTKIGHDFAALYKQVNDNLTLAMQIHTVKPELFYDVSLLKNGAKASDIAATGDNLTVVDTSGKTAYAVGIPSKTGQSVASGDYLSGIKYSDIGGDNIFAFADGGIYKLPIIGNAVRQPVVKKDDTWGTIGGLVSFGGNLYLLDTQKGRIWKYIASETGFGDRREYLNPDTLPDFSHATDFAIDGSVWIGTTDGKILKFVQGVEQTFELQGVDPAVGQNLRIYTADEANNLYILDQNNNRVVVTGKDGIYIAQYKWSASLKITAFVVSEKNKKVLLLTDGLIYSFDLQ